MGASSQCDVRDMASDYELQRDLFLHVGQCPKSDVAYPGAVVSVVPISPDTSGPAGIIGPTLIGWRKVPAEDPT